MLREAARSRVEQSVRDGTPLSETLAAQLARNCGVEELEDIRHMPTPPGTLLGWLNSLLDQTQKTHPEPDSE